MNCKIIFTSLANTASSDSHLMLQLSMLLKQQSYSASFGVCDFSSPLSAEEIDSALTSNELVIIPDSSENILTSPLADAVLKSIGTLKKFAASLPIEYLTSATGDRCGYIIKSGKHSIVILSGFSGVGFSRSLNSLAGYLSTITGRYTAIGSVGILGNTKSEITRVIDTTLPSLEYELSGSGEDFSLCFALSASRRQTAEAQLTEYYELFSEAFGIGVYNNSEYTLQETVVGMLKSAKTTVSTAESCTGGLIAKLLTDVSGSSEIFEFGVEAYSNRVKIEALGIDSDLILQHGAVSAEVAKEMALSVRDMAECALGISVTGVAGPSDSEGKPVGTVFVSLTNGEKSWIRLINPMGLQSRDEVRRSAARIALDLIRRYLIVGAELEGACSGDEISILKRQPGSNNASNGLAAYSDIAKTDAPAFIPSIDPTEDYIISSEEPIQIDEQPHTVKPRFDFAATFGGVKAKCVLWAKTAADFAVSKFGNIKNYVENYETPEEPTRWDGIVNRLHLSFILPVSSDKIKAMVGKCLILLVAVAFILTSVIVSVNSARTARENKLITDLRERWSVENNSETDSNGKYTSFNFLNTYNPATIGWFRIQGTDLSYPVVSAPIDDHDYYKNHNFLGSRSKVGTLYTPYGTGLDKNRTPDNTVIYGNNLSDNTMFGSLKEYRNLRYYKSHSRIHFKSLYKQSYYNIFAVYIISDNPKDDNGYLYPYAKNEFDSERDFNAWLEEARARSLIVTDVDVRYTDRLLTLVTDADDFKGAKLVIVAREFRDDERYSIDDTENAKVNPNPLYPKKWYDENGGRSPYGTVTSGTFKGDSSKDNTNSGVVDGGIVSEDEEYTENSSGNVSNFGTGGSSTGPLTTSLGTTVSTSSEQTSGSSSSDDEANTTTSSTVTSSESQSSSDSSEGEGPSSSSQVEQSSSSETPPEEPPSNQE